MNRRYALLIFLLIAAPLLIGCGHPWTTVVEARPNPFLNQRRFAVFPVTYSDLYVGNMREIDYLGEKDRDQRESWQSDKATINQKYTEELVREAASRSIQVVRATGPADAPYFIRTNVSFIEPGFFSGVVNKAGELKMTIQITDSGGRILDEILVHRIAGGNDGIISAAISDTMSSGGRLAKAGGSAGVVVGKYLQFRVEGED